MSDAQENGHGEGRGRLPGSVLVTGAAGYVGGPLVRALLEEGVRVTALDWAQMAHGHSGIAALLDHPRLSFIRGDVRDADAVRPLVADADAVVHLAAIVGDPACSRDLELARSVNIDGSRVMIDAAAEAGLEHFVFVSTCSNYGISEPGRLADEDDPLNPISLYAESKVEVERLLTGDAPVPATCLRLATVYGVAPRMRLDLTVNQFAVEAETTRRLSIYGADHWRPYVHVEDVARAIVTVLSHPDQSIGRTFNVGDSDENYTKRMMYELLRDRVPGLDAEWVGTGPDLRSYRVSFARIGNELPFRISRRVPDGMDEVIEMSRSGGIGDIADPVYRN